MFILVRVDQKEDKSIVRGRGRPRRIIGETINEDLELNGLSNDIIFYRTQWCCLMCAADPT